MQSVLKQITTRRNKEMEQSCERVGYYLVHHTGRYFISVDRNEYALNKLCNKVLSDTDYQYWIDYSLGKDVNGDIAWVNLDQSYLFI